MHITNIKNKRCPTKKECHYAAYFDQRLRQTKGVTYEAIRKNKLVATKTSWRLQGHHRRQLLDETAVAILDKHREGNSLSSTNRIKTKSCRTCGWKQQLTRRTVALLNENKALIEKSRADCFWKPISAGSTKKARWCRKKRTERKFEAFRGNKSIRR